MKETIEIYGDGYVTSKVSTIPTNEVNKDEESRVKFVTDLAAISRGKDSANNPVKRFNSLLKEAAPYEGNENGSPSRPLEFAGVILEYVFINNIYRIILGDKRYDFDIAFFNNNLGRYSYTTNDGELTSPYGKIFTNVRACVNAGIKYEDMPFASREDLHLYDNFKALKIKVPMFVFNHLITHTALSKEARSERVVSLDSCDYWLPEDFIERVLNSDVKSDIDVSCRNNLLVLVESGNKKDIVNYLLHAPSQAEVQKFFKDLGYPKEIYQRAMLEFRYKEMLMVGWVNDPNSWTHLFLERNAMKDNWKNWTQSQTEEAVVAMKEIIKK